MIANYEFAKAKETCVSCTYTSIRIDFVNALKIQQLELLLNPKLCLAQHTLHNTNAQEISDQHIANTDGILLAKLHLLSYYSKSNEMHIVSKQTSLF